MSICVENVSYIYGKGTPFERAAVEDIDLTIDKGEFIGIIGHTGSGKSTLIQDRKSTRLNSSHRHTSRMPSSA